MSLENAASVGVCRLCLEKDVLLQESHYIPKAIYKSLRDNDDANPNPVTLSDIGVAQTSKQKTAKLLCSNCEQRFSKNGENWVLKHILRTSQISRYSSLENILRSRAPDFLEGQYKIFYSSSIGEVNVPAISYFAASIFWRGSIHKWGSNERIPVQLGPFQEQFRQYLMMESDFPKDCCLWATIRETDEFERGVSFTPFKSPDLGNMRTYSFAMPGIMFLIIVSKNISANHRKYCLVRGKGHPLLMSTMQEAVLKRLVHNQMQDLRKAGRLREI